MIETIIWVFLVLHLLSICILASAIAMNFPKKSSREKPLLSVVIAARNELENLKKLIPNILDQQYPQFEIIIALDRCSDSSKEYLNSLSSDLIQSIEISDFPKEWDPKKYALHTGINEAKGDFMVFTDADCLPASNNWLSQISENIDGKTDIILGLSPYLHTNNLISKYIQYEAFMTHLLFAGFTLLGRPYMGVGRNLAIRKSFFLKNNGYERIKHITGGDDDLFIQNHSVASNTKVMLGKESLVYTYPKKNWTAYYRQKIRHFSVGTRYKSTDQLLLTLFHSFHLLSFLFIPFILDSRIVVWMFLFYLFIKLVSYRFASSKMGFRINYILIPLVDFLYAVQTPVLALWSKLVKDIKWKN